MDREFRYCQCSESCDRKIYRANGSTLWSHKIHPNCKLRTMGSNEPRIQRKSPKKAKKRTKWQDKPLGELTQYVQSKLCNPYIRERDSVNFGLCISSGGKIEHAGHYFSVGSHSGMRFRVDNIHGQSIYSNKFKHGDLLNYRKGLIRRHGEKYISELDRNEELYNSSKYKADRFDIILIGLTYKHLLKEKIWIFDQKKFLEYKDEIAKNNTQWKDG